MLQLQLFAYTSGVFTSLLSLSFTLLLPLAGVPSTALLGIHYVRTLPSLCLLESHPSPSLMPRLDVSSPHLGRPLVVALTASAHPWPGAPGDLGHSDSPAPLKSGPPPGRGYPVDVMDKGWDFGQGSEAGALAQGTARRVPSPRVSQPKAWPMGQCPGSQGREGGLSGAQQGGNGEGKPASLKMAMALKMKHMLAFRSPLQANNESEAAEKR